MGFDFGSKAKKEPAAGFRTIADLNRQYYIAHRDEGFTKSQALEITIAFAVEAMHIGQDQNPEDESK